MEKFFDYFDQRHRETSLKKTGPEEGPVITISRLTGCDARQVAENVVECLNRKTGSGKWKWVDKDIIYDIAKELNTNTERVENFYKGIELSNMSEMIMAFSGGFVSDLRVKKAIRDVVLSICKDGHVVLVGRGGVSIAHNIADSLHIRLIAPFYWRVENVMKKKQMDIEKAEEYVVDTDEKRHNLITTFLEKKSVNIDYLFDATINRQSFSIFDIAEIIVSMYERKIGRQMSEREQKTQIF
jgi:cytidylate kinase